MQNFFGISVLLYGFNAVQIQINGGLVKTETRFTKNGLEYHCGECEQRGSFKENGNCQQERRLYLESERG